jgi:hypothetical protein
MLQTEDQSDDKASSRRAKSRVWQYTLGSLLAFIAGMAVMLAVLLPFVSWPSRGASMTDPHFGLTGAAGIKSQNCAACHRAGSVAQAP